MLKDIEKYRFYLGKEVLVKVDRRLGEKHPNFDFIYPIYILLTMVTFLIL